MTTIRTRDAATKGAQGAPHAAAPIPTPLTPTTAPVAAPAATPLPPTKPAAPAALTSNHRSILTSSAQPRPTVDRVAAIVSNIGPFFTQALPAARDRFLNELMKRDAPTIARALVNAMAGDHPDAFIAALSALNKVHGRMRIPDEPAALDIAMAHVLTQARAPQGEKYGIYAMYLVARWIQAKHLEHSFMGHRLTARLDAHVARLLAHYANRREAPLLKGLIESDGTRFRTKWNACYDDMRRRMTAAPDERRNAASALLMMVPTMPSEFLEKMPRTRIMQLFNRFFDDKVRAVLDGRFVSATARSSALPLARIAGLSAMADSFSFGESIGLLREMVQHERSADVRSYAAFMLTRFVLNEDIERAHLARDDIIAALLKGATTAGDEDLARFVARYIHTNIFTWPLPQIEAQLSLRDTLSPEKEMQRRRAIEILGMIPLPQAMRRLAALAQDRNPKIADAALQALGRNHTLNARGPVHKALGPKGSYYFPAVADPAGYHFSQDRIPLTPALARELAGKVDWNKDGVLQDSYERYQLWHHVGELTTALKHLEKTVPRSDLLVDKVRDQYRNKLNALMPLYAQLPRVDFTRQTVRVYGRDIHINGTTGALSQKVLFAVGEALQSAPPHLIDTLLTQKEQPLRFRAAPLEGTNVGANYDFRTGMITLNTKYLSTLPMRMLLMAVKHEIGHAVDRYMGTRYLDRATCVIQSKYRALRFLKIRRDCKSLIPKKKRAYLSRSGFPDFVLDHRRRLKDAGITVEKRSAIRAYIDDAPLPQTYTRAAMRTLHVPIARHFAGMYGTTHITEDFATMWEAYWTLRSPWSKRYDMPTREDVHVRSPLHYSYFEELWNSPNGSE